MSFLQQLLRSGVGYTREGGEIIYNWKDNPSYYILNKIKKTQGRKYVL